MRHHCLKCFVRSAGTAHMIVSLACGFMSLLTNAWHSGGQHTPQQQAGCQAPYQTKCCAGHTSANCMIWLIRQHRVWCTQNLASTPHDGT